MGGWSYGIKCSTFSKLHFLQRFWGFGLSGREWELRSRATACVPNSFGAVQSSIIPKLKLSTRAAGWFSVMGLLGAMVVDALSSTSQESQGS